MQITEKPQKKEEREEEKTVYFDDRVGLPATQRGKKQFRFNDPGMPVMYYYLIWSWQSGNM